jgi:hypothetical protein
LEPQAQALGSGVFESRLSRLRLNSFKTEEPVEHEIEIYLNLASLAII